MSPLKLPAPLNDNKSPLAGLAGGERGTSAAPPGFFDAVMTRALAHKPAQSHGKSALHESSHAKNLNSSALPAHARLQKKESQAISDTANDASDCDFSPNPTPDAEETPPHDHNSATDSVASDFNQAVSVDAALFASVALPPGFIAAADHVAARAIEAQQRIAGFDPTTAPAEPVTPPTTAPAETQNEANGETVAATTTDYTNSPANSPIPPLPTSIPPETARDSFPTAVSPDAVPKAEEIAGLEATKLPDETGKASTAEIHPSDATQTVVTSSENHAGISAAQQTALMNKGTKAKQFSDSTEQKLPAVDAIAAEKPSPANPVRSLAPQIPSAHENFSGLADSASIAHPITTTASVILPTLPPISLTRAADRLQDLVMAQAVQLRSSNDDSLQVVIKPGAGLQLSLDLRQQGDAIEVRASLQHGDFNFLNRHWSDLQQQLEARGIRLSPLTSEQSSFSSNANSFQQRQSSSPQELAPVVKTHGLTLEGVVAVASAARVASKGNRWETWA